MPELVAQTIIDGMQNGTIDKHKFFVDEVYRNECFESAIKVIKFVNENFKGCF